MAYEQISYRVEDRIATLTLQRPDARNGYTVQMADELAAALAVAGEDDDVRVVVLTGAGTGLLRRCRPERRRAGRLVTGR